MTLQDPELAALSACVNERLAADPSATGDVCPLVDWLIEHSADLPDVLRLYAGTPPEHTDGIHQQVLARWLRQHEDAREEAVGKHVVRGGHRTEFDHQGYSWSSWPGGERGPVGMVHTGRGHRDAAVREVKRRTLALFPEVEYAAEGWVRSAGRAWSSGPMSQRWGSDFASADMLRAGLKPWVRGELALREIRHEALQDAEQNDAFATQHFRGRSFTFRIAQYFRAADLVPPEHYPPTVRAEMRAKNAGPWNCRSSRDPVLGPTPPL